MPDRVLILANALVHDAQHSLPTSLRRGGPARELLVIAPLLTTRTQSICSDVDGARRAAERRLNDIAADMSGFRALPRTVLAEEDQVQAVADALAGFDAEECVVVTRTQDQASRHEAGVSEEVYDRFRLPTTTLTVDGVGHLVSNYRRT